MQPYILASASPRRREICDLLGFAYEVIPAQREETLNPALPLEEGVLAIARAKAEEVAAAHPSRIVIGADTVVAVDADGTGERVLGKPADAAQAAEMLRLLQGRRHRVLTAVWVAAPDGGRGFTDQTQVEFLPMSEEDIAAYLATGEPLDKAGAYGIQGYGMRYIRGICGDFYTVMGLPGARLRLFMKNF